SSSKFFLFSLLEFTSRIKGIRDFTLSFDGRRWCFNEVAERGGQYAAGNLKNLRENRASGGHDGISTTGVQNGVSR
ncbi:hypothetical protein Goklo_001265, partial [Gossypium klotzschianum]|nr:hypothetical protein [Gossypium klotzschianum]